MAPEIGSQQNPDQARIAELESQLAAKDELLAGLVSTQANLIESANQLQAAVVAANQMTQEAMDLLRAPRTVNTPLAHETHAASQPAILKLQPVEKSWFRRNVERLKSPRKLSTALAIGALAVTGIVGVSIGNKNQGRDGRASSNPELTTGNTPRATRVADKLGGKAGKSATELGSTVDNAVEHIQTSNEAQFRQFVIDSYAHLNQYDHLNVSHNENMMSRLKDFNKNASTNDIKEGGWLSTINNLTYRADAWKALHGMPITADIPQGVSAEQQLDFIYKFLSDPNLKTDGNFLLNGLWANGSIDQIDGHTSADNINYQDVRAVRMEVNGHVLILKVGGGSDGNKVVCLNIEEKKSLPPSNTTTTVTSTSRVPATNTPTSRTPTTRIPSTFTPSQPPTTTPTSPPTVPPKHDRNPTPAGVPGENHGSGTNTPTTRAGSGPAGQTPNTSGYVPSETQPAAPAPAPTPAPLETAPAPTGPAVTGTDPGKVGAGAPSASTGTGTTVPTGSVNPQG